MGSYYRASFRDLEGDFEAVSAIAKRVKRASVAVFRAAAKDIDRCAEAVRLAAPTHSFVYFDLAAHAKYKLPSSRMRFSKWSRRASWARNLVADVEWSAEERYPQRDGFSMPLRRAAIKAGATTINIPDTVGYTVPREYVRCSRPRENVPNSDKAASVHCHNDLGLRC
jgi:2-isopropylmalate synthase